MDEQSERLAHRLARRRRRVEGAGAAVDHVELGAHLLVVAEVAGDLDGAVDLALDRLGGELQRGRNDRIDGGVGAQRGGDGGVVDAGPDQSDVGGPKNRRPMSAASRKAPPGGRR